MYGRRQPVGLEDREGRGSRVAATGLATGNVIQLDYCSGVGGIRDIFGAWRHPLVGKAKRIGGRERQGSGKELHLEPNVELQLVFIR